MHPPDCPEFEYETHPLHKKILKRQSFLIIYKLQKGCIDPKQSASDTRKIHRRLFKNLTPSGYEYYAGNYRGDNFRCLKYYSVGIRSDRRVGDSPDIVINSMEILKDIIKLSFEGLDNIHKISRISLKEKIKATVKVACKIFENFLRIHPYANGNGHAARFCIWAILGKYGYWPESWPIEPRPLDPPYTYFIVTYRNGYHEPLEEFVLNCIDLYSKQK